MVLLGLVCVTLAAALLGWASPAAATPMYSVSSAHACNTCHVEPTGWLNPDKADRRCTLDCQGCHVNPSGGGLRTPLGEFYGEEVLPMFGPRPGESANPARFLREGEPSKGEFDMFGAWNGGWWPGEVQHQPATFRLRRDDADACRQGQGGKRPGRGGHRRRRCRLLRRRGRGRRVHY
jgi:hypothetical protein